ncbi:MCP four helix bundle domain-containing protein, partial [Burkholderia pseudomallei]|uniref:MCP four helix bundle domain-containing protein n=1 Tax=Burkholderia pseudomallei TaxID=28450 RepID=UPI00299F6548
MFVMIAIGLGGTRGLATLSSAMSAMYTDSTVPIEDLASTQAGALQMRLNLERLVATRDAAEAKTIVDRIREREKKVLTGWNDYYPAKITAVDERKIADRIAGQLGDFRALASTVLGAVESGNVDATAAAIDKIRPLGTALTDSIDEDIAINAKQVKEAADQGNDTFHTLLWVLLGIVAIGVAVAIGAWQYLQRAITHTTTRQKKTYRRAPALPHTHSQRDTRSYASHVVRTERMAQKKKKQEERAGRSARSCTPRHRHPRAASPPRRRAHPASARLHAPYSI